MSTMFTTGKAAGYHGIGVKTLQRWDREGRPKAERMGWVNKVVPKDKLDEEVNAWCKRLLEMSPQSLRIAKFSLNYASDTAFPQITHGLELSRFFIKSPEMVEGATAFMEKRKPDFYKVR